MTSQQDLKTLFEQSIAVKQQTMATLLPVIHNAGEVLAQRLNAGSKVLSCGNGGSAADAQHFAAELVNRFETERRGLAAIALTTDSSTLTSVGNDDHFEHIFSRQVKALGRRDDLLLAISTSGNSKNVLQAIIAAQELGMKTIALTGGTGGAITKQLNNGTDIEICVPTDNTARTQETHILIIHCLCHIVDSFFSHQEPNS